MLVETTHTHTHAHTHTHVSCVCSILFQADIEKMVRDAEEHAEADKKRRDLIEAKNSADSAVYG